MYPCTAIDLNCYPRRAHFDYFRSLAYPYVGVTVSVDITEFLACLKVRRLPFFLPFLYYSAQAANSIPELRQRIRGNGIVEYPVCQTSHTVAKEDGTYAYCELDPSLPFDHFLYEAHRRQEEARTGGGLSDGSDPDRLFFVSCVPWLSYTNLVQPVPSPADSNPRITWGKYVPSNGRISLPVSLLANHALVDGLHLAAFYEQLSALLADFSSSFSS